MTHGAAIHQVQQAVSIHNRHLIDMHRHMEDLDNRGRRRNLHIRGIPESVEAPQLQAVVWAIFNTLLGRPPDAPVEMERCHRALRPRGRDTDLPRDAVCCLVSFTQKEKILRLARNHAHLEHEGARIQLFQGLSTITLQHRRDLRPLLQALRERRIPYRWKFPFCLQATNGNHTAQLRTPANLRPFCDILGMPMIPVPDWYGAFLRPEPWIPTQPGNTPRSQRSRQRRHRPSADSLQRRRGDMETDENPHVSPSSARRKTDH